MTAALTWLLGRMPVGWLQLTHNKGRLASAIAGVGFANLLVFVQLGIMGSMNTAIRAGYALFDAQIMISAEDANSLTEGSNLARQWMLTALAQPGVVDGAALYLGNVQFRHQSQEFTFRVLGLDPEKTGFLAPALHHKARVLTLPDVALIDLRTRGMDPGLLAGVRPQTPLHTEITGHRISFVDSFIGGVGFAEDGYMITSDQTMMRLFPRRHTSAPNHILLKVAAGHPVDQVVAQLREVLPDTLRIRTLDQAADEDVTYQTTERPTGLIFGFGVVMGILVGIVIVYQVLSTDVADHLSEYATFKAMGYGPGFFLGIIFEQATILALLGFVPGSLLAWGAQNLMRGATSLPIHMVPSTTVLVFLGTLVACGLSGAVATRRLNAADPADLFR